jgi:hypothetical protein
MGGLVAVGLIAAACSGGGDSGVAEDVVDAVGTAAPAVSETVAAPDSDDSAAPVDPADAPVDDDVVVEETLLQRRVVEYENSLAAQEGRTLFLPLDATVTPAGDEILRIRERPSNFGIQWSIAWDVRVIDDFRELIVSAPRDGIQSIDAPKFETVEAVDSIYRDDSPVIQFEVNGDARAYPLDILTWHEIVNDIVGGVPVSVTFCPLCNTAIAFERTVSGGELDEPLTLEFGTTGLVRSSDLVMYDRTTETLWQQIGGKALVGGLVGAELKLLPATIVSWKQFRESFPDGLVLSRSTVVFSRVNGLQVEPPYGDNPYTGYDSTDEPPFLFVGDLDVRLSPFERVVTLDLGDEFVAYPFVLLEDVRVFHDTRKGDDIVVLWIPGGVSALDAKTIDDGRGVGSTGVFKREVDGESLTFTLNPDDATEETFVDEQTGSVWNIFGAAVSGPLAGRQLETMIKNDHFWFAWAAFQPDTEIVTG